MFDRFASFVLAWVIGISWGYSPRVAFVALWRSK